MLLAQSLLGHSYQLLRPLSSGGTGTIHLAQDIHQKRQVAVKVVPVDSALQENSRVIQRLERLFREKMQALTQLNHARIVPIFDSGLDTSGDAAAFYVVMAYCPEGSLANRLAEGARLAPAEVASVLTQTAEALHHAHERGVVHQDLKPSNLLISSSASLSDPSAAFADLQLADAGLAPFFAGLTGQGISQSPYARGTSMFIAPEQWDGQAVPASDQYALAAMAFYLLTGQYPFQGSLSQLIQQHHSARPPAPSTFNRQLGAPTDKIIRRALAKQPEKRFPSVLDFAQAFASAQQLAGTQPAAPVLPVPRPAPGSIPALFSAPLPVQSALTTQLARQEEEAPDLASSSASHDDPAAEKIVLAPAPSSDLVAEATVLAPAGQAGDDSTILPVPALESADKDATLLAQPPDLTSTEPRLVAQPPSLASEVPTQLASEPSGARGPTERPATRPFGLSAAFSAALAIRPASGGQAGQSALSLKQAPTLPPVLPALPANQASIRRWHFSTLQKSLVVILLSLVVLLSSSAFLVNSIIAASHAHPGGTGLANGSNDGGGITIIVSPTGVDQTPAAGSTSTPTSSTSGNGTTPNTGTTPSTGSTPNTGTTPSTGSTPNSGAGPVPTPTTAPAPKPTPVPTPKPTPKPTPHPCVVASWSSTLSPTFSAGGTEHFVSSYCNGVVSMTWTATPPSGGHEVDMQICFALRTTNCSAWVRFTGANVWKVVITGLHSGQGFYINNRCPACTGSAFKIYGEVKY